MYDINDKNLIEEICSFGTFIEEQEKRCTEKKFVHPLDEANRKMLKKLIGSNVAIEYSQANSLDRVWNVLLDKSIRCLRFFDKREPFIENGNKVPVAYGMEKLEEYHKRYAKFESLLYGANSFYRDHVFHVIRTWMLGVFCLIKQMEGDKRFIDEVVIEGTTDESFTKDTNFFEKISMWTVIALCHDLGYPLEKSQQILDKTKDMMKEFIPNPNIWNNFGFSGIQDNINEYIVKFISTKMKKYSEGEEEKKYLGRIQPKYYLKFAKSLEHFSHGIISSVIVYKMLLYFLESDFNLNDDYVYTYEDARQFYIRREILRSMAAHTCTDIYNIYLTTFSSILFLCDELQEWGRKSWNDLYAGLKPDAVDLSIEKYLPEEVVVKEIIKMENVEEEQVIIENIIRIFKRQYELYKVTFRDGQYTQARNFNLIKNMELKLKHEQSTKNEIIIQYMIRAQNANVFKINLKQAPSYKTEEFKNKLEEKLKPSIYWDEVIIES